MLGATINDFLEMCGDVNELTISTSNHYSLFKMFHKHFKKEPYYGANIPVLQLQTEGLTINFIDSNYED